MASTPLPSVPTDDAAVFDEQYDVPCERDFSRFRLQLCARRCLELQQQGFVCIDEFLGRGWALALLQEMKWLSKKGLLLPNETRFGHPDGRTLQFSKPNIWEADLHDSSLRNRVPELRALFFQEALNEALLAGVPGLRLTGGTQGRTLKLQLNAGNGGCFPAHYDNPGPPNKRCLTCLLYLNPDWEPGDGGEMCLLPFLGKPTPIAPKLDRMVLFYSDQVLHRVLPCHKERFVLTVWLDGPDVNRPEDSRLSITRSQLEDWLGFCEQLKRSPVQRVLSRGVYEERYEESLVECMEGAEGFEQMMSAHRAQVASLKANKGLYGIIQRLRQSAALNELS